MLFGFAAASEIVPTFAKVKSATYVTVKCNAETTKVYKMYLINHRFCSISNSVVNKRTQEQEQSVSVLVVFLK